MTRTRSHILPVIVIAQFFCTSLWFAGNAILPDLALHLHIPQQALGSITSAVQFGFIAGTLVYAGLLIADRFG
ncbi:MAG: MFS transporter, partial [Chitinophagaceae bacterium]|nr:MFS transporter [Chitinophagaceae bacterium]